MRQKYTKKESDKKVVLDIKNDSSTGILDFLAPTRSPRRGDLVRACVRACGIFCKMTVKMSSRSILKSPGGF